MIAVVTVAIASATRLSGFIRRVSRAALAVAVASACLAASQDVRTQLAEALKLMRQGRWQEAAVLCDQAQRLATGTQKVEAVIMKARALWVGRRYRECGAEYRRAAAMPGATDYQRLEAWRGARSAASAARDTAAEAEAIEELLKIPRLADAERAQLMARLGELYLAQGRQRQAMALFARVVAEFPDQYGAATARGHILTALIRAGKIQAALDMLKAARDEDWRDAESLHIRAAQLLSLSDADEAALKVYDELLRWRPASEIGWRSAWRLYAARGRGRQLVKRAAQAAQAGGPVARAVAGLAETMGLADDDATRRQAMELYRLLMEKLPGDRRVLLGAARLALRMGDVAAADKWTRELLEASGDNASALRVRAEVLAHMGQKAAAVKLLEKAAGFDPSDLASARRLAAMLSQAGLADHLPAVAARVRRATGKTGALSTDLAMYYARKAQWEKAVDELARAVSSGEASERYAQLILRSWLSDVLARGELLRALDARHRSGSLPPQLAAGYLYALLSSGAVGRAEKVLKDMPLPRRQRVAAEVLRWGVAPPQVRTLLYEAALGGRMNPTAQASLAMALADDLIAAGEWARAAEVLRRYYKPGLPGVLARRFELALSEALLQTGAVKEARALAEKWAAADDPRALVLAARCEMASGNYDAAQRLATRAMSAEAVQDEGASSDYYALRLTGGRLCGDPARAQAALVVAECKLRRGLLDDALAGYRKVIEQWPETEAATAAAGRLALVTQLFQLDEDRRRDILAVLQALDRGDVSAAEAAARAAPGSAELAAQLELLVAQAVARRDRGAAAMRLEELANRYPKTAVAALALLTAAKYLAADRPAAARRLATRLTRDYPASALVPLAQRLIDEIGQQTGRS